jgi:hypothetical protein
MRAPHRVALFSLIFVCALASISSAQTIKCLIEDVRDANRAIFGKSSPKAPKDPSVEELAKEIDWLEHLIETFGTIVPKQPDVWGEARLTRARFEYDREVSKRFNSDDFKETLQASVRQSDQAALSLAFALNAASGGASAPTSNAAVTLSGDVTDAQGNPVISRLPPLGQVDLSHFSAGQLSLEPTEVSRQLDVYLNTLNNLRRVNEGGDTADSPGYALNLLRIPVSVLAGHHTRKGFGAEVEFTMTPVISEDLLPTTSRNLIINDVADLNSLMLAPLFNNEPNYAFNLIQSYWRFKAQAAKWVVVFDFLVSELERFVATPEGLGFQSDLEYLYTLRPYLQFRLLQIAAQADDEKQQALGCLKCLDSNGEPTEKPDNYHTEKYCPLERVRLSLLGTDVIVSVSALQLADFLDGLAEQVLDTPGYTAGTFLQDPMCIEEVPVPNKDAKGSDTRDVQPSTRRRADDPRWSLPAPTELQGRLEVYVKRARPSKTADGMPGDCDTNLGLPVPIKVSIGLPVKPGDLVERQNWPLTFTAESETLEKLQDALAAEKSGDAKIGSSNKSPRIAIVSDESKAAWGSEKQLTLDMQNVTKALFPYRNLISLNLNIGTPVSFIGLFASGDMSLGIAPHSGTGKRPLVGSQLMWVYGYDVFWQITYNTYTSLRTNLANRPIVHVYDINKYLAQELRAAYEFLDRKENAALWCYASPELSQAIDAEDVRRVTQIRETFLRVVGGASRKGITAALAWTIIVDAARLNDQLIQDMKSVALAKQQSTPPPDDLLFVGPKELITPDAHEFFRQYCLARWPIITFSIDPVNEEQNVADVFSRRRDLQLAVAVAVATGNSSPAAAGRFTRRLELDMETIALNRTSVAFSNGSDTFGWRFYPRVQSPDTPGTIGAFTQTLFGTANRDNDMKTRQLEPGIRDCTAVVIMPSFIPYVDITTRANWFGITNPRKKELTLHDTMRISRNYQTLQNALYQTCDSSCYRPADIAGMRETLQKLETRMPFQTMRVEVPYQNTLGGFDLFETGISGLGPELLGWYGAPGVDPDSVTTLYLVGKRFSVHETRVIAGGRTVPIRMLSRNVLELTVPPGVQPLSDPTDTPPQPDLKFVDIQVGAPYGVSSHMLVPLVTKPGALHDRFRWVTAASTVHVAYSAASPGAALYATVTPPPQIQLSSPTTMTPTSVSLNLTISEILPGGEEIILAKVTPNAPASSTPIAITNNNTFNTTTPAASATSNSVSARLDVRTQRYVIDVDQYNSLIQNLMSAYAARAKAGITTPQNIPVTWLIRGSVTFSGATTDEIQGSLPLNVHFIQK